MVFAMLVLILFVALLVGLDVAGDWSQGTRISVAFMVAFVTLFSCWRWHVRQVSVRLSISGTGQIRLQKQEASVLNDVPDDDQDLVTLLPVSTIWPQLMILHLQNAQRRTHIIVIMRDSVSQETFSALLVACRWMVMRQPEAELPGMRQN